MMTIDQALAKAGREIDALIDRRLHDNAIKMLECGVSMDDIDDHLREQRALVASWRAATLDDVRQKLLQEPW